MNQNERRRWLIQALLEEMPQYQYPVFPYTADRQWRLLRSLMNVRPPMPVSEEFLRVQDAFLKEMTEGKGIVDADSLPLCAGDNRLVLWQGDITTLQCDAIVRSDNKFVEDEGWQAAAVEYETWLTQHPDQKIVFLEIGVGYNTPGIIKYSFWQQVYQNRNATYACLNLEEERVPEEIRQQSMIIGGDSAEIIKELVS